ncbi:hypothetical protein ACSLMH_13150 [Flavobacterium columnare]|uniref:hypothetical protein n=1 Tax=Flavobacterium columnare TaxID=996 RepID=UPI001E2D3126|nr:hypothetical protein [Flavobacterium columnare]
MGLTQLLSIFSCALTFPINQSSAFQFEAMGIKYPIVVGFKNAISQAIPPLKLLPTMANSFVTPKISNPFQKTLAISFAIKH